MNVSWDGGVSPTIETNGPITFVYVCLIRNIGLIKVVQMVVLG